MRPHTCRTTCSSASARRRRGCREPLPHGGSRGTDGGRMLPDPRPHRVGRQVSGSRRPRCCSSGCGRRAGDGIGDQHAPRVDGSREGEQPPIAASMTCGSCRPARSPARSSRSASARQETIWRPLRQRHAGRPCRRRLVLLHGDQDLHLARAGVDAAGSARTRHDRPRGSEDGLRVRATYRRRRDP